MVPRAADRLLIVVSVLEGRRWVAASRLLAVVPVRDGKRGGGRYLRVCFR